MFWPCWVMSISGRELGLHGGVGQEQMALTRRRSFSKLRKPKARRWMSFIFR